MNRKTDTQELDIPKDDIECWTRYPKYRWVYELSRLLDSQHIRWSLFEIDDLTNKELNIKLLQRGKLLRRFPFGTALAFHW